MSNVFCLTSLLSEAFNETCYKIIILCMCRNCQTCLLNIFKDTK